MTEQHTSIGTVELLPCPFCGKSPESLGSGEQQRGLMIECMTDGCVNPHVSYYDHAAAKQKWNTRAPAQQMQWQPIEHRPLPSGKYLVGHRGHQEIMHFFGPEKLWVKGTQFGWHRLTDKGWQPDDPAARFHATHCWLIETPALPSTEGGAKP